MVVNDTKIAIIVVQVKAIIANFNHSSEEADHNATRCQLVYLEELQSILPNIYYNGTTSTSFVSVSGIRKQIL